jgi:hypothetical protein
MVMMIVAGAATLPTTRNSASVEDPRSSSGVPGDASGAVVMFADASVAAATPDAAASDAIDASVTSETVKADKKNLQQSSRRKDDAKLPESNRPSIDDRGN